MRRHPPLLLLLALGSCAPAPAALDDAERSRLLAEVTAAVDSVTAAMNAHDPDGVLAFYDLGPSFLYAPCTQFLFGGDLFASVTGSYYASRKDVSFEIDLVDARILARDAAVVGLRMGSDDPTAANPVLTSQVLLKGEDGRWRISFQHQSWPNCAPPKAPHPMTSDLPAEGDTLG